MLIKCQHHLNCDVPLVLEVRQRQGILCYQELPGSQSMSQFLPHIVLVILLLSKINELLLMNLLLLFAKIHNEVKMTYSFPKRSRRAHRTRVSTLSSLTLLTLRSNHSLGAWWALE